MPEWLKKNCHRKLQTPRLRRFNVARQKTVTEAQLLSLLEH
jgi:hypothetical protein